MFRQPGKQAATQSASARLCLLCLWTVASVAAAAKPEFLVHEIATPNGDKFGQTSAVDIDGDGDVDFVSGRQRGNVYWLENVESGKWPVHLLGNNARTDVGGVAFDVDRDGWIDQVSGGTWFRNPGKNRLGRSAAWTRYENGAMAGHDNLACDINGDGKLDLVALLDEEGVSWYEIPTDPTQPWIENKITGVTDPQCHGGVAAGDVDGDNDLDIFRVDRWFENADARGTLWVERRVFDFGKVGPWGIQTRAELVDIDDDGDLDLIQAEGDVYDGRVACFINVDGMGASWQMHLLQGPGHHQDFHSMNVADFDCDGDLDVFAGGGPLTQGEHVWFVWENLDGEGKRWQTHRVQSGYRTHESVAADVDGDGDIDLLTKPWNGNLHLFAENVTEEK